MAAPSIRFRLTVTYTLAFGILLAVLSISLYRDARARLYAQADAQIEQTAAAVRPLLSVSQSQVTWLVDKKVVDESSYLIAHAVFDEQGRFLDGSSLSSIYNLGFTDAAQQAIQTRSLIWETVPVQQDHQLRTLNTPITGSDGRTYLLRTGMLLDQAEDDLRQLAASLTTLGPLVMIMGALAGWWLAGGALQPVADITATAKRISASNLTERLPLRGTGDELDRLSTQLNEMISRLENSFEQMSQFISNVSHELRTPLAALRGSSEIALRGDRSQQEYRALLERNLGELDRLGQTVSDLLAVARAEAGQLVLKRRPEDLVELTRDAVESTRALADERGIAIEFQADGEITAEVDPTHFLRLLINLLDNAIKYNRSNGRVDVSMKTLDGWALISITDTGPGIPAGELPHIFDRFYRGQGEHSESIGGTGLGLGLANGVVVAHGGRLTVESQPGEGCTFRVWLPLKAEYAASAPLGALPAPFLQAASEEASIHRPEVKSLRRSVTMLQHVVRGGYWLGIVSAVIAIVWRIVVDLGVPPVLEYPGGEVSYKGFINGAFLFLLIAAATAGYLSLKKE